MDADTKPRRCPRWIKIALSLSLAVNLAIIGLVAGFALRGAPLQGRGPAIGYAMPYVLALPRELRREVFSAVRDDDTLPNKRARRGEYRQMVDALQATPFDVSAVEAVLALQADGVSRVQATAKAAWLDALTRLSDEERLSYAERMQEALERRDSPNKPKK